MTKLITIFIGALLLGVSFWLGTIYSPSTNVQSSITPTPQVADKLQATTTNEVDIEELVVLPTECETPKQLDESQPELKAEIAQKLKELNQKVNKYKKAMNTAERRYADARKQLIEAGVEVPEVVSQLEADKLLPKPFSDIIANGNENLVEKFKKLEAEEVDYDWGADMQQRISDFVVTHELGLGIRLDAVRCKSTLCEIRGFETAVDHWRRIALDMRNQPWWQFSSTNSSSKGSNEKREGHFYMIAQRR